MSQAIFLLPIFPPYLFNFMLDFEMALLHDTGIEVYSIIMISKHQYKFHIVFQIFETKSLKYWNAKLPEILKCGKGLV